MKSKYLSLFLNFRQQTIGECVEYTSHNRYPAFFKFRLIHCRLVMANKKSVMIAEELNTNEPPKKPWQDSLGNSGKALSFLLTTGMLSDITFAVGPQGKQFRVSYYLAN